MPLIGLTRSNRLMSPLIGGPPGGGAAILLDTYPNAAFAYSLRKLRSAYAGSAVRIREDGGDTESDIGFDSNGDFDTAAASSHIGANNGFITTWYDQSGNGLDVTQTTASLQPPYSASGFSSKPCLAPTSTEYLSRASVSNTSFGGGSQGTFLSAMQQASGQTNNTILHWRVSGGNTINIHASHSNTLYLDFGSNNSSNGRISVAQPGGWDDSPHILEMYRDSSDDQAILVDGSSLTNGTRIDDLSTGTATLYVFAHSTNSSIYHSGPVAEIVWWGTDLGDTDRAGARNNMNDYYSVF